MVLGSHHTEDWRKAASERLKIKHPFAGKKHTPEAKEKMRQAKLANPIRYWLGKDGHIPSEDTRKKMREASIKNGNKPPVRRGPESNLWRGGITPVNKLIRGSSEYKNWRTSVFERDEYTCVICGQVGGTLNADHIKPFLHFPELRFDIDNGRTLCHVCHTKTDTYGHKVHKYMLDKQIAVCQ